MTCSRFSVLGTDSSLDETAGLAIFSLGPVVSADANVSASLHFGLAASARSLMSKRNKPQPLGFNWSDNGLINIGLCKSCLATSIPVLVASAAMCWTAIREWTLARWKFSGLSCLLGFPTQSYFQEFLKLPTLHVHAFHLKHRSHWLSPKTGLHKI